MPERNSPRLYHHRSNHHHDTSSSSSKSTEQDHRRLPQTTSSSHRQSSQVLEQGSHSNENYPEFHMSSNNYDIIFLNNETTSNELNMILRHVRFCRQYSIDTESDQRTNRLSLIQVNSMPVRDKSIIMLFELEQLPHEHSTEYDKIRELFCLLFRKDNELFAWGDMRKELEPKKDLFTWPIPAVLVNLQLYFPGWYAWGRSQCRGTTLSYCDDEDEGLQQHQRMLVCSCHLQSPYNPNELWSLKNAFKYGFKLFIDKSARLGNWSSSLNSRKSSLSYETQKKMIRYAVYEVITISFLARPIAEQWTFKQVESRSMKEALLGFNSVKFPQLSAPKSKKTKVKNLNVGTLSKIISRLDSDLDSISSDDEIYLDQMNEQIPCDYQREDQERINNDRLLTEQNTVDAEVKKNNEDGNDIRMVVNNHDVVIDEMNIPPVERRHKKRRSEAANKKRNQKRNRQQRQLRYRYTTTRPFYHRMKSNLARKIIRHYNVKFRHIKKNEKDGTIIIGCYDREALVDCQQQLPNNCFDRYQYERFRR